MQRPSSQRLLRFGLDLWEYWILHVQNQLLDPQNFCWATKTVILHNAGGLFFSLKYQKNKLLVKIYFNLIKECYDTLIKSQIIDHSGKLFKHLINWCTLGFWWSLCPCSSSFFSVLFVFVLKLMYSWLSVSQDCLNLYFSNIYLLTVAHFLNVN